MKYQRLWWMHILNMLKHHPLMGSLIHQLVSHTYVYTSHFFCYFFMWIGHTGLNSWWELAHSHCWYLKTGVCGNEIADGLARGGLVIGFLGPDPALGVSGREIKKRLSFWLFIQHWARWHGLGDTPRQAQEFISRPSLGAKEIFLSFNRTQARAVTGLLTGHNTLRRHLHLLGLVWCAGGVKWKRRLWPTFCVNVRLWPPPDTCTWALYFWSRKIFRE